MSELHFSSSLSIEEIENNFKNVDLFSGITKGLEEALAYEKGKAFDPKRSFTGTTASF